MRDLELIRKYIPDGNISKLNDEFGELKNEQRGKLLVIIGGLDAPPFPIL